MARIVHFEINADNPERCKTFYEKVFGWEISKVQVPHEYWMVKTGDDGPGIDGGMMRRQDPRASVLNTIQVDDIDAAITAVESNGGKLIVPKAELPQVGYLAYFQDTEGNMMGIMQINTQAK